MICPFIEGSCKKEGEFCVIGLLGESCCGNMTCKLWKTDLLIDAGTCVQGIDICYLFHDHSYKNSWKLYRTHFKNLIIITALLLRSQKSALSVKSNTCKQSFSDENKPSCSQEGDDCYQGTLNSCCDGFFCDHYSTGSTGAGGKCRKIVSGKNRVLKITIFSFVFYSSYGKFNRNVM